MSVAFTYELTGPGWAEATISNDGVVVRATVSYLSDALDDLLRAVVNVTRGVSEESFSFLDEPGEYRWHLRRVGDDQLLITITWFDDWEGFTENPGKVVFQQTCRLRSFAVAVSHSCRRLLMRHGPDGYRKEWIEHYFPLDRLGELQALLSKPAIR